MLTWSGKSLIKTKTKLHSVCSGLKINCSTRLMITTPVKKWPWHGETSGVQIHKRQPSPTVYSTIEPFPERWQPLIYRVHVPCVSKHDVNLPLIITWATTGCLCGWSMARSRESSPLSFSSSPRKLQRILVCKSPREINRLFACLTQSKMSINILDHVRTLAVLLVAMLSNGGSRRAATAPAKAKGGASPPFLPTFCNNHWNPNERDQTTGLFLRQERTLARYSKAPPESLYDLSKFFCQANSNEIGQLLFLLPQCKAEERLKDNAWRGGRILNYNR